MRRSIIAAIATPITWKCVSVSAKGIKAQIVPKKTLIANVKKSFSFQDLCPQEKTQRKEMRSK